ncbi:MAG: hypothetical protein HC767_10015 [Akkermansiaceae bacterium]|nr:hypothetical protein [Akkermansiaceae bacterium]
MANADPSRMPKYMTEADVPLASIYFQIKRRENHWESIPLRGENRGRILESALALGNLFFGARVENTTNRYRIDREYRPLIAAPALKIEAAWESFPDGTAQPILRCENPDVEILPVTPLYYLDRANATIGLLESELPAPVLHAWSAGPKIASDQIESISTHISSVPTVPLPTPSKMELEIREATPPQPYLRIHMAPFPGDGRMVTFGELTFSYGDSPRLIPLLPNSLEKHNAMIESKRIVWPRSFTAEQKLEKQLRRVGFISTYEIAPSIAAGAPQKNLFIPEIPRPTPQLAWLSLLGSPAMDQLRAAGWTIEIDPKSGLTAHDANEFFPSIEADPDHGIDWFRFDATYELDGKSSASSRSSLMSSRWISRKQTTRISRSTSPYLAMIQLMVLSGFPPGGSSS